jgi:hypothetical protein
MLKAGLDGIKRRLPLPEPVEESIFQFDPNELQRRSIETLPSTMHEALDELLRVALQHLVDLVEDGVDIRVRRLGLACRGWRGRGRLVGLFVTSVRSFLFLAGHGFLR